MNTFRKLMLVAFAQIFAITILAGCNTSIPATICHFTGDGGAFPYEEIRITQTDMIAHLSHANDVFPAPEGGCPTSPLDITDGKITICHSTGDTATPYNEIIVSVRGLNGHGAHEGDIIPVPEGGCPTSPLVILDDKITICHATGDEVTPYEEITVRVNGLDGHVTHESDIVPAPAGGCPTSPLEILDGKITICHATGDNAVPYEEITVSVNGLNGHVMHEGDIIPAPENGCPTIPLEVLDGKIKICHATGNETNPYNEITVSLNGLNGHVKHVDDLIPAPQSGCPTTLLDITDGKIKICHATGNEKNPFNEITVSINGLNGHGDHEGDLIPMPAGGCPVTK